MIFLIRIFNFSSSIFLLIYSGYKHKLLKYQEIRKFCLSTMFWPQEIIKRFFLLHKQTKTTGLITHTYYPHLLPTLITHTYYAHLLRTLITHTYYPYLLRTLITHTYYPHLLRTHITHIYYPHLLHTIINHTYNQYI